MKTLLKQLIACGLIGVGGVAVFEHLVEEEVIIAEIPQWWAWGWAAIAAICVLCAIGWKRICVISVTSIVLLVLVFIVIPLTLTEQQLGKTPEWYRQASEFFTNIGILVAVVVGIIVFFVGCSTAEVAMHAHGVATGSLEEARRRQDAEDRYCEKVRDRFRDEQREKERNS